MSDMELCSAERSIKSLTLFWCLSDGWLIHQVDKPTLRFGVIPTASTRTTRVSISSTHNYNYHYHYTTLLTLSLFLILFSAAINDYSLSFFLPRPPRDRQVVVVVHRLELFLELSAEFVNIFVFIGFISWLKSGSILPQQSWVYLYINESKKIQQLGPRVPPCPGCFFFLKNNNTVSPLIKSWKNIISDLDSSISNSLL